MDAGAAANNVAVQRLQQHLATSTLLTPHARLLVALSGGLDSVVLLHALRFACAGRWQVSAAHFDHRMRASSGADADWVRGLSRAWQVPLVEGVAETPSRSEADARSRRYAFLQDALARTGADVVLTAHHADDQAETILFRLLRGTGTRGLAGIPARRGPVARPLLRFTRAHLRAYARARGLAWREDPSNADERFARNRIRHRLLPALEAVQPGAGDAIRRIGRLAARMEKLHAQAVADVLAEVVEDRFEDGFALARDRFLAYPLHIRARVIRHLTGELGSLLGRASTAAAAAYIESGANGGIRLPRGVLLEREFERLLLHRPGSLQPDVTLLIAGAGSGAGPLVTGGQRYVVRWGPASTGAAGLSASFDPSSLQFPLQLRGWLHGDRIRLAYGSKKLKKLFQERRTARSLRSRTPVLVDAAGRVLWVPGHAVSHGTEARAGTGFLITVVDDHSF